MCAIRYKVLYIYDMVPFIYNILLYNMLLLFNNIFSSLAVPPQIHVPNQLVGVPTGDNVTIECHVEAFPQVHTSHMCHTGNVHTGVSHN